MTVAYLKLVSVVDGADVETVDLQGGADGFTLAENGWLQSPANDADWVQETMILRVKGASVDAIAAADQKIGKKARQARQYFEDDVENTAVYLRVLLDNETSYRQALVRKIIHGPRTPIFETILRDVHVIREYTLALERRGLWEAITVSGGVGVGSTKSTIGGMENISTIAGDEPGLISSASLVQNSAASYTLTKFWLGVRGTRWGTPADFAPAWSMRLGTIPASVDTTVQADSDALDNQMVECTFATVATLATRISTKVSDVTTKYTAQRGQFTALLRAKNTAAGTTRVRLVDGFYGDSLTNIHGRVAIASTSYNFYELGTVNIPSPGQMLNAWDLRNFALSIDAERISGACSLDIDCIVLIPMEGMVACTEAVVTKSGTDLYATQIIKSPRGDVHGEKYLLTGGAAPTKVTGATTAQISGGIPPGTSGVVVLACQRATVSDKTDSVSTSISWLPRYRELRGAG